MSLLLLLHGRRGLPSDSRARRPIPLGPRPQQSIVRFVRDIRSRVDGRPSEGAASAVELHLVIPSELLIKSRSLAAAAVEGPLSFKFNQTTSGSAPAALASEEAAAPSSFTRAKVTVLLAARPAQVQPRANKFQVTIARGMGSPLVASLRIHFPFPKSPESRFRPRASSSVAEVA